MIFGSSRTKILRPGTGFETQGSWAHCFYGSGPWSWYSRFCPFGSRLWARVFWNLVFRPRFRSSVSRCRTLVPEGPIPLCLREFGCPRSGKRECCWRLRISAEVANSPWPKLIFLSFTTSDLAAQLLSFGDRKFDDKFSCVRKDLELGSIRACVAGWFYRILAEEKLNI